MSLLAPFAMLLALAAGWAASPADKVTKESLTSGGRERAYYLYVPSSAAGKAAPLLVLLHGSRRRGDVLVESWKGLAKKEGVVLVGPDSLNPDGWLAPDDGPDFLRDVVEAVVKSQKIDNRRVYLFGHSAGAVFGLYMGLYESRYFAAVAVSAGAFRDPNDFTSVLAATRKIPFAVWLGTEDRFFSLAAARETRDAFLAAGLPFDLHEMKGHDHNYYVRSDEINKAAWAFLAPLSLASDPEFEPRTFR